jgi:hypothetical protein
VRTPPASACCWCRRSGIRVEETRQIFTAVTLCFFFSGTTGLIEATARVGTPAETLSAYARAVSLKTEHAGHEGDK